MKTSLLSMSENRSTKVCTVAVMSSSTSILVSPTKLLPIFMRSEGMASRSPVMPHLLQSRSLQKTPVVILISES